ncbi:CIA30 family protein [Halomonas gemina]|uniref:CIA30 family protein n=1 Tax=Halomonas gemina TaxID=2945105 RepID=UPI00325FCE5F
MGASAKRERETHHYPDFPAECHGELQNGGISRGGLHVEDGSGVFSGETSLENNGGFASVRRDPEAMNLSDASGLVLYVRGDGRCYQLRLRNYQLPEGTAYRALFQPPVGEWQHVALPLPAFEAMFRGRRLEDAPLLDPGSIQQLGLLIADKQPGPFRLEAAWIETIKEPKNPMGPA